VPWQPIHPNHAIERTRVIIQFATPISNKMAEYLTGVLALGAPQGGLGPREGVARSGVRFLMSAQGAQVISQDSQNGAQFARRSQNGEIVEAVLLDQSSLIYETSEYVRWALFQNRFSELTSKVVEKLAVDADIGSVTLEYFDRFIFEGQIESAVPNGLIHDNLLLTLAESARNGKEIWHIHRGWFEGGLTDRFLVNQNVDVQEGQNSDGESIRSVALYTKVEQQAGAIVPDLTKVDDLLEKLHLVSTRVVRDALQSTVQKRIGLLS
jgi:uncharacterized protein (TIGR04255 family)